jgi:flavin reductase (DIM6/NTAB) family NADH-FMN oxidoreductase RutF
MKMRNVDPLANIEKTLEGIRKGAFLTVRSGGQVNTMAIGWATIGYIWQRPVLMVAVRNSRHTFGMIEKAADFTVSIPLDESMRAAVDYCGAKSGRTFDKFKECNLKLIDGKKVESPVIEMTGRHFECKIVLRSAMDPGRMDRSLEGIYPQKDWHTLYFGEILECYETRIGDR